MLTTTRTLMLAAGLAGALTLAAVADDDMPVSTITLYRSGVGYFERHGLIDGDAQVHLKFKADQINDILKSMILLDLDGGRIESVSYGSREPLSRRLASFGIDISDNPDMGELLNRVRGSRVAVETIDGPVEGAVLGVEDRASAVGDTVIPTTYLNLLTDAGMRSVAIDRIASLRILDEQLASELNKALAALAEQRADTVKTVDVTLRGDGARSVVAAYVHEMPVWKTSYRLILPDSTDDDGEGGGGGGLPTIQGWAIVENTTDVDWQDVRLSLVAGQPISFIMDLYEPLHATRPEVPVPTAPGVAPRVYEGGEQWADKKVLAQMPVRKTNGVESRLAGRGARAKGMRGAAGEAYAMADRADVPEIELDAAMMADYAAQVQARAGEVGEVFQYTLEAPVSIARQRSAMLPILSAAIDGRRVSIYNRHDLSGHPMRGVELTNNTSLQLMPGPISVYDGAAYAGDSQIGHVSAGDKRLLAYAVDLDVTAVTKDDSTSTIQKIKIANGTLVKTLLQRRTVTYAMSNKDKQRPRTILIEHERMPGWDLRQPEKPAEETEGVYRFEMDLEPGGKDALKIVQEHTELQYVALTSMNMKLLVSYSRQGKVSDEVIAAVRKAGVLQDAINQSERRIKELDAEVKRINTDQDRIRRNMGSIDRQSDLYRMYMKKLTDQETRLEQINTQRGSEQDTLESQREELKQYLAGLNVE